MIWRLIPTGLILVTALITWSLLPSALQLTAVILVSLFLVGGVLTSYFPFFAWAAALVLTQNLALIMASGPVPAPAIWPFASSFGIYVFLELAFVSCIGQPTEKRAVIEARPIELSDPRPSLFISVLRRSLFIGTIYALVLAGFPRGPGNALRSDVALILFLTAVGICFLAVFGLFRISFFPEGSDLSATSSAVERSD